MIECVVCYIAGFVACYVILRAWGFLTPEQKKAFKSKLKKLGEDNA